MKGKKVIIAVVGAILAVAIVAAVGVFAFGIGKSPKVVFMKALADMAKTDENSLSERVFGAKEMMERTSSESYRIKLAVSGDSGEDFGEMTLNAEYAADPREKAVAASVGAEVGTMDLIKLGATAYQDELAIQIEPIVDAVFIFDWGAGFREKAESSELFPMIYSGDLDEFEVNMELVKNAVAKLSDINSTNKRIKSAVDIYSVLNNSIEVEKVDGRTIEYGDGDEGYGEYKTKGYSTVIPHDVWVSIIDGYKEAVLNEFLTGESTQVAAMRDEINSEFDKMYSETGDIKLIGYIDSKGVMRELEISLNTTASSGGKETPTSLDVGLNISMLGKKVPSDYIVVDITGLPRVCYIKRTITTDGTITAVNTYSNINEVESDQTITFDESTNAVTISSTNTIDSEDGAITSTVEASGEFTRITKGKGFDFELNNISMDGAESVTCNSVEFSFGFIDTAVKMPMGKTFDILESRQDDLDRITINTEWIANLLGLTGFGGDMPDIDYGGMEEDLDSDFLYSGEDSDTEIEDDGSNPFDFSGMGSYGDTGEGETGEGETDEGETSEGETSEGETSEGETAEDETLNETEESSEIE